MNRFALIAALVALAGPALAQQGGPAAYQPGPGPAPAPSSATPSGAAGGDLGGTYPNPTALKTNGVAFGSLATLNSINNSNWSGTALSAGNLAAGAALSNLGYTPANVASNLSDLASAASARTNLGLATVAASGLASDLTGTLGCAQLPALTGNVTTSGCAATIASLPAISGANLTGLNGSNVSSGTVADARLSANAALYNGTSPFTAKQTINLNATAAQAAPTGTILQEVGTDATAAVHAVDAFGASAFFVGRRWQGTNASPTAVQSNTILLSVGGRAFDGTAIPTTSTGALQVVTSEIQSATNHGTDVLLNCTAITTLTTAECARAKSTGFTIPTGSTYQINGTQITTAALSDAANIALLGTAQTFTAVNKFPAGSAAAPALVVGGGTTGLYSVSTTGLGLTVNGTVQGDFGITHGSAWTMPGQFYATYVHADGQIQIGAKAYLISPDNNTFGIENLSGMAITYFGVAANNVLHLGKADSGTPVAQTLGVQGVVAGTTNTAGANFTIAGSQGTGTGAGGSIVFQTAPAGSTGTAQNALVTALTIDSTQNATFAGIGAFLGVTVGGSNLDISGGGFNISNYLDANQSQSVGLVQTSAKAFGISNSTTTFSTTDVRLSRLASGEWSADTTTTGDGLAAFASRTLVATGAAPTLTGTCTTGTQVGGNTAGSFAATCVAQTVIATFAFTAPHGYVCDFNDLTTPADSIKQTASSTTSCTATGTTVAADVISFHAVAY